MMAACRLTAASVVMASLLRSVSCASMGATAPAVEQPDIGVAVPESWTAFGDPALDQVVQRALERNRDLVAAASRLE